MSNCDAGQFKVFTKMLTFSESMYSFLQTKKADVDQETDTGDGSRDNGSKSAAKKDHKHNALAVLRVFLNVRNGSWILTIFFAGTCNGLIWGFLFWHLDNLGNSYAAAALHDGTACI